MQDDVSYDAELEVVHALFIGEQTTESASKVISRAVALARTQNCTRFLFDAREAHILDDFMESFRFMSDPSKMGLRHTDRIASLYKTQAEKHGFSETVARNRGWEVRYFIDEAAAIDWLTHAEHPDPPAPS